MTISRAGLAYPSIRKSRQVPVGPVEIDWSHDLGQGLTFAFMGLQDLTANIRAFSFNGAAGTATTQAGAGVLQTANNQQIYATTPTIQKVTTGSIFWYGNVVGNPSGGNTGYVGILANNSVAPPFDACTLGATVPGNQFSFFDTGNTTTFASIVTGMQTLAVSFAGTSAAILGYRNGIQVGSETTQGGFPAYSSTSLTTFNGYVNGGAQNRFPNAIGNLALFYNRVLSPNEMAWLNEEPFAMIRQKIPRVTIMPVSASAPTGSLFLPSTLSLGSGGPFFSDRLAS